MVKYFRNPKSRFRVPQWVFQLCGSLGSSLGKNIFWLKFGFVEHFDSFRAPSFRVFGIGTFLENLACWSLSVCWSCHNKVPQSRWHIVSLFWRLDVWDQSVSRVGSSRVREGDYSRPFSQVWWCAGNLGHPILVKHHPDLCLLLYMGFSLRVCLRASQSPCPVGHQSYWMRACPNDFVLTRLNPQTPYFLIRSHSGVPGVGPST